MVNVTVSVSDELKAEMDKYSDVNWSEVTRKCIQAYLQNRKNDPLGDFKLINVRVNTGLLSKPQMGFTIESTNKTDSELIIDRIFFEVYIEGVGWCFEGQHLKYERVLPNYPTRIPIDFYPEVDVLRRINSRLEATFTVELGLDVYVQGFASPVHLGNQKNRPKYRFPIDEWKNQVKATLDRFDADWKPS
jgi:hypothetical protein